MRLMHEALLGVDTPRSLCPETSFGHRTEASVFNRVGTGQKFTLARLPRFALLAYHANREDRIPAGDPPLILWELSSVVTTDSTQCTV
jgi:hypothetical protein